MRIPDSPYWQLGNRTVAMVPVGDWETWVGLEVDEEVLGYPVAIPRAFLGGEADAMRWLETGSAV